MSTRQAPPDSHLAQDGPSTESVLEMLRTPWNEVYALSQDGNSYIRPQCLRDTPVAKLTENSPYWRSTWHSLDEYLAQEEEEERLKKETGERLKLDPTNKSVAAAHKLHQDNVSKHRRIRDIFGPNTRYHPNQLVAKHHLPDDGLCQKEIMYRLACKISDLRVLHEKNELAMDPFDFMRWRISKKILSFIPFPGSSARDNIRTIVYKICEDCGSNPNMKQYEDVLLRSAILRSAGYQNRIASFTTKVDKAKPKASNSGNAHPRPRVASGGRPRVGSFSNVASNTSSRPTLPPPRVDKHRPQPSAYMGINAWREQRRREAEKNKESNQDSKEKKAEK
ncbi:hypothetical protein CEP54_006902 [Fusarium duplospermum]|uniref:Uncharacterized protein n=1 Tax=Fusarium duplospermum TaxID=1325734 RepID=A0A428Q4P8_9HYPO|nr:hypothetical protein CEP54_006902 [Fusarium duplospermum]